MITEFQSWHKGDIPDRSGYIVEGFVGDYLEKLYHCDTWNEATDTILVWLAEDEESHKAEVHFRREWRK